ncbi:protein HEATR9 isoform X2 [Erinaceus europaeus]|uniref:Protein HEATR9 isoform X2 n=1 Tax=Erinaceus europaeus TaxID=9365 RepID=A0ABM3YFS4_ERIEU|nr:protein HEATR9 isoform X2 [Erinaceus europaeus]
MDRDGSRDLKRKDVTLWEGHGDVQQIHEKGQGRPLDTSMAPYIPQEVKRTTSPIHRPMTCNQVPREEFPPSPECWRKHPQKPNAVPYCYFNKPELYTHWHNLYGDQDEPESQKMVRKIKDRDHSRYRKEGSPIYKFYLPMSKLTIKPQIRSTSLDPTGDPLKCQRLKELTKSLNSPREDEQTYAAQALGSLGISDKSVMETLRQVARSGSEKVKYEAYRSLAILGCLNKNVIQALMKQLKGQNKDQRLDALRGLRMGLNSWAVLPKKKRMQVGKEDKLVSVLQTLIKKSSNEIAVEAALCLGFLRPCNNTVQEFLLQCLCQGPKTEQMKALEMLVKMMHVHSAVVIRAILDQLCHSSVLEHRFEAIQMLRTIGLKQIQEQKLEELTFDLLRKKTHNEPFHAMRQAVAQLVEDLNMKPMMLNLVEAQLINSNAATRQEAIISLGVLGIRSSQVFHLLLDMLDVEKNESVKKSIQETFVILASTDPWIRNKLKNKVFLVWETLKTDKKTKPIRFQKEPENPEELNIQDFKLAQLNPLFIAKSCAKADQEKNLSAPLNHKSKVTEPWVPKIKKQLQILTEAPK